MKLIKPTKAQERAMAKLTNDWQCAYTLQESIPTLEGLVSRGIAVMRRDDMGFMFSPRTSLHFKLKVSNVKLRGDQRREENYE